MNKEGRTFKGCLYFGLMITKDGPKVIEYNCRFGDPETQVVLPLLDSDLFTIMKATTEGRLADVDVKFKDEYACCVVMASNGYPQHYEKGYKITIDKSIKNKVYVAGASLNDKGEMVTSGGRVLGVVDIGNSLKEAIENAYKLTNLVNFDNAYFRKDIGKRALLAEVK